MMVKEHCIYQIDLFRNYLLLVNVFLKYGYFMNDLNYDAN